MSNENDQGDYRGGLRMKNPAFSILRTGMPGQGVEASADDAGEQARGKGALLTRKKTVNIAHLVDDDKGDGSGTAVDSDSNAGEVSQRAKAPQRAKSNLLKLKSRTVSIADLSKHDHSLREKLELAQDLLEETTPQPERQTEMQKKWSTMAGVSMKSFTVDDDEDEAEDGPQTEPAGPSLRKKLGNAVGKINMQAGLTKLLQASVSFSTNPKDVQMEEEDMRQCFMSMDIDETGLLDLSELQDAYAMSGINISKATMRRIIHYCRKSQAKGRNHQFVDTGDTGLVTFNDFKEMIRMRKFVAWNSNEIISTADLPISFGVVASSHRRKHILCSFLAYDYLSAEDKLGKRIRQLQELADQAAEPGTDITEARGARAETALFSSRDAQQLHDAVAAKLPAKLRARMQGNHDQAAARQVSSTTATSSGRTRNPSELGLPRCARKAAQSRGDGQPTLTIRRAAGHPTGRVLGSAVPAVMPLVPGVHTGHLRRRRRPLHADLTDLSTAARYGSAATRQSMAPPPGYQKSLPWREDILALLRRSAPSKMPPTTGMRVEPTSEESLGPDGILPGVWRKPQEALQGRLVAATRQSAADIDFSKNSWLLPSPPRHGRRAEPAG